MSRRRALVIGIDAYPGFGPEAQLAGAERDARLLAGVLVERHGFDAGDMLRLTGREATRRAVLEALATLRRRAGRGDRIVLFFSGHGSQMTDREGDEGDGLDETLVPVDSGRGDAENRDLTDDEIHAWAAAVLEVTPHLALIFDCCHSATLQRPGWKVRSVPPDLRPAGRLPPSPVPRLRDLDAGPRPLTLAACRDDERAYELPPSIAGAARGAFSFHFVEALGAAAPSTTWREVFERAAAGLRKDCPDQHPRLSGDGIDAALFGRRRSSDRALDDPPPADPGRRILELAAGRDRHGLHLDLFRSRGGAWHRVSGPGAGLPSFLAGDRLRLDARHDHARELYVYVLDVGLTGTVRRLFPDDEGAELLDPGLTLTIGARPEDRLEMFLPDGFGREAGTGHLVLVASEERLATPRLVSGRLPPDPALSAILHSYRLRRGGASTFRGEPGLINGSA